LPPDWTIEDAIEHGVVDADRLEEIRTTLSRLVGWMAAGPEDLADPPLPPVTPAAAVPTDVPRAPSEDDDEVAEAGGAEATSYVYKIHPAIGIARVGDSRQEWFVGPETPGRAVKPVSGLFRDSAHRIKRQAARFRVWEYRVGAGGKLTPSREITLRDAAITWTVNLANKKASFFHFKYLRGERTAAGKPLSGYDASHPIRNDSVGTGGARSPDATRRKQLWIDSGAVRIKAKEGAHKVVKDHGTEAAIDLLGGLRTDASGRLYVYGGYGRAEPKVAGTQLPDSFDNDGWFDDVSDGPVTAQLAFPDGRRVTVGGWTDAAIAAGTPGTDGGGAWVIVAPPDYAPQITNFVTLYDTLLEVARKHLSVPNNQLFDPPTSGLGGPGQLWRLARLKAGLSTYVPSYTHEVYPILVRVLDQRWVDKTLRARAGTGGLHGPTDLEAMWADLGKKSSAAARTRAFERLRPPTGTPAAAETMPKLWGDDFTSGPGLRLTPTMYGILERWKDGHFVEDWPGASPPEPAAAVTPDGLDRAALEAAVGGALGPGIETGWLVRDPQIYAEPFRLKHHADVPPGHLSQQLALPWHCDFLACHRTLGLGWWPAIRPDEVNVKGSSTMQPWNRDSAGTPHTRMAFTTGAWAQLGFVLDVQGDRSLFEERERR
jgi:hypothetical protein